MSCPPNFVLNPRSLKCVKIGSRRERRLVEQGNLPDYYLPPQPQQRQTVRRQKNCAPGSLINPTTGRCIKVGGRTFKRIQGSRQRGQPQQTQRGQQQSQRGVRFNMRRATSEPSNVIPMGTAKSAPLADRQTVGAWINQNCKNHHDLLTHHAFDRLPTQNLQELVRLHNRSCVRAAPLDQYVAAEHRKGHIAIIPNTNEPMTQDDFRALRDTMRRTNPGYKIPGRRHMPPPPGWKLYVASDHRSGPAFASVLYIDINQVRQQGVVPTEAVRADLGFIPLQVAGATCSPQMIVDMISHLSQANRLLEPAAGGWRPIAGFPFKKSHWTGPEAATRLNRLCRDLTHAVSSPI